MASTVKIASGHVVEEFDKQELDELQKIFKGVNDFVMLQPGNWVLPRTYLNFQEKVYNFKFRPDDVVIMTPSKCGTTWTQEIVWNMLYNPNLDNPEANLSLFARSPFLEADMIFSGAKQPEPTEKGEADDDFIKNIMEKFMKVCPGKNPMEGVQVQLAEALPGRRVIKTHFGFSLLNPELVNSCKVIFVARNPKDASLSFLHHHRLIRAHKFVGTQDDFIDYFVKERLLYGSFSNMVKEGWAKRNHPNVHFVFYEDLKSDIEGELKKINDFIGAGLTEEQLKNVKECTSLSSMKKRDFMASAGNNMVDMEIVQKEGGFINKGIAGGWKSKMTKEQEAKIDAYVEKNFKETGITFKYK